MSTIPTEPTHIIRDGDQPVPRGKRVILLTDRDPSKDVGRSVSVKVPGGDVYAVDRSSLQPIWVMPDWMEPHRNRFTNTGGNSVEELMNSVVDVRVNLPLAMLSACAVSQVGLLTRLHEASLLLDPIGDQS